MLAGAIVPAVALAHQNASYEGYDVSYTTTDHFVATICDGELDGRTAYVNFHITNSSTNPYRVNDYDGGSVCTSSQRFLATIWQHHTCESVQNAPDLCAPYIAS